MRDIILHYHIFKNAGTSIDKALKESFSDRWTNWDSDKGKRISSNEMKVFIKDHPKLVAISSHNAIPPLPNSDEINVYPIVFLRHPITRAYSAFQFEWGKQKGLEEPDKEFSDYIIDKFKKPRKNAIENFQVMHLANRAHECRCPSGKLTDKQLLNNAKAFIKTCPFFGLVERYNESMVRAHLYLSSKFSKFRGTIHKENISTNKSSTVLDLQVEGILSDLPEDVRKSLIERNKLDLSLYEYAAKRFITMGLE